MNQSTEPVTSLSRRYRISKTVGYVKSVDRNGFMVAIKFGKFGIGIAYAA